MELEAKLKEIESYVGSDKQSLVCNLICHISREVPVGESCNQSKLTEIMNLIF